MQRLQKPIPTGGSVLVLLCTLAFATSSPLYAREPAVSPQCVATSAPDIEVAFSPDAGAEALVLKPIAGARSSIRLAAYSFTSPAVVRALVDAKRRRVDVAVLVDYQNNLAEDRSSASRAALDLLVNAGIPTRTVSVYPVHHDKYIVVDGLHVETGSFNYSTAAAQRNSENALVARNNPALAASYIAHWQSRWTQGQPYRPRY